MGRCAHTALTAYVLLGWASFFCRSTLAKVTPFLEPGFFFDYNPPGEPVPIPVTTQCETIHIEWGRSAATGPNPTAPYSLQIYTSTSVVPFLVDAGSGLSFDWAVPFAPDTLYQICMFDKNGIPGGCQAMYTMIPNTTVSVPTCQNVTYPETPLDIVGTVLNGPMSRYGFVNQCTDISITPKNGTPPYTLTVAPSLHPPYNITSDSLNPINWTVSLSWASPFFMSLVDSGGNVWANGPMHSGSGSTSCLDTDLSPNNNAKNAVVGAGIGGVFGGLLLGLAAAYLFLQYKSQRREREMEFLPEKYPVLNIGHADVEYQGPQGTFTERRERSSSLGVCVGSPISNSSSQASSLQALRFRNLPSLPAATSSTTLTDPSSPILERQRSRAVYVVHHDGGGAPVTVYTEGETEVVELPPIYVEGEQATPTAANQKQSPE